MLSAGLVCTATLAGSAGVGEVVHGAGRDPHRVAGPAVIRRPPTRNRIRPASTVKHSSCSGWAWLLGTCPPGASRAPSQHAGRRAARRAIVICSPLSGLLMTCGRGRSWPAVPVS